MEILTRLEEMFLLTILQLCEDASLVTIRKHLLRHAGKDWAFGSLYMALSNMERKDLVRSRLGEPRGGRGGKAVKTYRVTDDGLAALAETKKVHDALWRGFPASSLKEAVDEK